MGGINEGRGELMIDAVESVVYSGKDTPETKMKTYGNALTELANRIPQIVCLSADLTSQTEADLFRSAHRERFFSMGMAEQNMVGVAAGMARAGEIPFIHSFACFITRRCFDQIAMSVAYPRLNVKLVGMMPGISSPGGASHQAIDDLALMRVTPNMTILDLGEATEVEQAITAAAEFNGPMYIRMRRGLLPVLLDKGKFRFELGQSYLLRRGTDISLITSGLMTERALQAGAILADNGISTSILHVPSIKPLDVDGILTIASQSRALITLDNHSIIGGLGSAVAEVLAEHRISIPFHRIGLRVIYGMAASNEYLYRHFGFDPDQIAQTALQHLEGDLNLLLKGTWSQTTEKESGWGEDWKDK
jgi:transketolase